MTLLWPCWRQVIKSARVMKKAVGHLLPYIEEAKNNAGGACTKLCALAPLQVLGFPRSLPPSLHLHLNAGRRSLAHQDCQCCGAGSCVWKIFFAHQDSQSMKNMAQRRFAQ